MFKIGDIVRRKNDSAKYVVTSMPWKIGGTEVIKIAPVPDDGLYLLEELRGCVRTDTLEKIKKSDQGIKDE